MNLETITRTLSWYKIQDSVILGGDPSKTQNKNKRDGNRDSDDRLRDLPEWLEEFTDNLEDTKVPACANTSHDPDSERPTKVASRKAWYFSHFTKDRNCEVCKKTKIISSPCRKRAEKFGDLMTADHNVLNEGGESRNNHRYAVEVQDLASQWIRSYPCKTKNSQEKKRSLLKVPRTVGKAESHSY